MSGVALNYSLNGENDTEDRHIVMGMALTAVAALNMVSKHFVDTVLPRDVLTCPVPK